MRPSTEGEMLPRVRPPNVETIRIGKNRRITIGCTEEQQQFRPLRDWHATDAHLLCGPPAPGNDRGVETKHLFDRSWD